MVVWAIGTVNVTQTLGRFEIERELGRGAFGVVYLARDPGLERLVAVKVLSDDLVNLDPRFRARFQQEARIIAGLKQRSIVQIHEFGEHDGRPYFVMEYMRGGSLAERLRARTCLTIEEAFDSLERVAQALDEAHRKGVVHRDVKPQNILFDEDGAAFLSDFSIAKRIAEDADSLTGGGSTWRLGTPGYMSPEQLRRDRNLDRRSDVYSLGVVLFHVLAGRLPYPPHDEPAHLDGPVPNILDVNPRVPKGCRPLLERAMAKDPNDRFPTAGAFALQLKKLVPRRRRESSEARAPLEPTAKAREERVAPIHSLGQMPTVGMNDARKTAPPRRSLRTVSLVLAALGLVAVAFLALLYNPWALGNLQVTGMVGTHVFLDGETAGVSPLNLALRSGRYDMTATSDDWVLYRGTVDVHTGANTVIVLEAVGSLSVRSPVPAQVSLDGGPPRDTPAVFEQVPVGLHELRARGQSYEEETMVVDIQEKMNHVVTLEMRKRSY